MVTLTIECLYDSLSCTVVCSGAYMLNYFFAKNCVLILMKFNEDVFFINKDHDKRYLLYMYWLLYILKFALERQVNSKSNKV